VLKSPISLAALRRLLLEIDSSGRGEHVLAIGGPSDLAPLLRQQFLRGGADPGAVQLGDPEGADVYVRVLAHGPDAADEAVMRRARREHVPVIAVVVDPVGDEPIPYVLATDVVPVAEGGQDFRLETIAQAIAARLGEHAAPLAGRVPLLRPAVTRHLVESYARKNGLIGAAIFIPGADLPVLALNEIRLVLRLAQAYGEESGPVRLPELAATLGAGFGLRTLARELLGLVTVAGWAVKGAVAYGGTRALGEAARQRYEFAATPRRDAAAPAGP
jgi:uncharacterized protein (DUF697 family)